MHERDPEEHEIWCADCNCYLYSMSIYDNVKSPISCPTKEKCRAEANKTCSPVRTAYTGMRFW